VLRKSPTARPSTDRRRSSEAGSQLAMGAGAVAAMVILARQLRSGDPPEIDLRVRHTARSRPMRAAKKVLWPLFPLGLPGVYITIAYATARALHRRRQRGGPAIVTSAWLGWLVHRAAKLVYTRERPRRKGKKRRTDSFPSGHTTGATALALTAAYVLRRRALISLPSAAAIASIAPIAMGAYRVIDDEHWATDVVGGWLLGAAIGLTCNAALADSAGGAARHVRAPEASPRVGRRRARPEPPTFVTADGRDDFLGDRADTARPSVR
jgi:membrane-associated phospholipid phosphatase